MYYRDVNGIEHEDYNAACRYYGADTPDQIDAEERMWAEIEREEWLDHCTDHAVFVERYVPPLSIHDEIPF